MRRNPIWADKELSYFFLKPKLTYEQIANLLPDRSFEAVRNKGRIIHKNPEWKPKKSKTRFSKGFEPWNKGRYILAKEQFEKFVIRNDNGCWSWTGCVDKDGYGTLTIARRFKRAPRVSWEIYKGFIPGGMIIRHNCDNPICTNPEHLCLGSQKQNINDSVSRNRFSRGSKNGMAKLNEKDVKSIRKDNRPVREIAKQYGVLRGTIYNIKKKIIWAHVK